MRTIKFRGKCLLGYWRYGSLDVQSETDCEIRTYNNDGSWGKSIVVPKTVGQFTGLHDANGKEIYEGDIISQNGDIIGIICFSSRYGVSVKKNSTTWSLVNFCIDSDFDSGILSDVEVIGNIHDKDLTK